MKTVSKPIMLLLLCVFLSACATKRPQEDVFEVSLSSHNVVVGEVQAQFLRPVVTSLRADNITVLYFPAEDAVCLQYRADFIQYHQFWSRDGRQAFIKALEQYNADFEARNLVNNMRSRQRYGSVEGFLIWQANNLAVQARGNMDVDLGYSFRERVPYFSINQGRAGYINPNIRQNDRTSTVIPIFFTRSQAAQLAEMFDQFNLQQVVMPEAAAPPPTVQRDAF